jgi:hypothetical protein
MRFIKVPTDAALKARKDQKTGDIPTKTFRDFIMCDLGLDARWFADEVWEKAADAIWSAFDECKAGDVIEIRDDAHEKLELVVRAFGYAPDLKPSLRWFVRAVTGAEKIDPRS